MFIFEIDPDMALPAPDWEPLVAADSPAADEMHDIAIEYLATLSLPTSFTVPDSVSDETLEDLFLGVYDESEKWQAVQEDVGYGPIADEAGRRAVVRRYLEYARE